MCDLARPLLPASADRRSQKRQPRNRKENSDDDGIVNSAGNWTDYSKSLVRVSIFVSAVVLSAANACLVQLALVEPLLLSISALAIRLLGVGSFSTAAVVMMSATLVMVGEMHLVSRVLQRVFGSIYEGENCDKCSDCHSQPCVPLRDAPLIGTFLGLNLTLLCNKDNFDEIPRWFVLLQCGMFCLGNLSIAGHFITCWRETSKRQSEEAWDIV